MADTTTPKPSTATTPKPSTAATAEDKKAAKRMAFLKLAPNRVGKALKAIALIGNLANATYDYEPHHVSDMMAALERGVTKVNDALAARFIEGEGKTAEPEFQFSEPGKAEPSD